MALGSLVVCLICDSVEACARGNADPFGLLASALSWGASMVLAIMRKWRQRAMEKEDWDIELLFGKTGIFFQTQTREHQLPAVRGTKAGRSFPSTSVIRR